MKTSTSSLAVFSARGFTVVELLTVTAIITLLSSLLFAGINRARAKVDQAGCLNNIRQLQFAWQMYTEDHLGTLPENYADQKSGEWRSSLNSWSGPSSAPTDTDSFGLKQGSFVRLGYIKTIGTFRCPGDDAVARARDGRESPRTRSYSMNGNLGGRHQESQSVLNTEKSDIVYSKLFVFVDEHEDSIDDAHFLVWSNPDDRWVNLPSGRHNRTGVLSFADGHAEAWRWLAPKKFLPRESYWKRAHGPDLQDLRRLQAAILSAPDVRTQP